MSKDYEYQAYMCNIALYGCLATINSSGVPDENSKAMLNVVGKSLLSMSMSDKPIEYYIRNFENWKIKGGN